MHFFNAPTQNVIFFMLCIAPLRCVVRINFSSNLMTPLRFLSKPTDLTVMEDDVAVFRCIITEPIDQCQWFYLPFGHNFHDVRISPELIMDFKPRNNGRDCTIKFSKARKTGQLSCRGINFYPNQMVQSEPVSFRTIPPYYESIGKNSHAGVPGSNDENEVEFSISEGVVIKEEGDHMTLELNVNRRIQMCSWIAPNGIRINPEPGSLWMHGFAVNYQDKIGICSYERLQIGPSGNGNFLSILLLEGEIDERLGPSIQVVVKPNVLHQRGGFPDEGSSNRLSSMEYVSENEIKFKDPQRVIYGELAEEVTLACNVNRQIRMCSWIPPWGTRMSPAKDSSKLLPYNIVLDSKEGICSMTVSKFRSDDKGIWFCALVLEGETVEIFGPELNLSISGNASRPGDDFLDEEGENRTSNLENANKNVVIFRFFEEQKYRELGQQVTFECNVNRQIQYCYWTSPSGKPVFLDEDSSMNHTYTILSNYKEGKCSILLSRVKFEDEGKWTCSLVLKGIFGERFGPNFILRISGRGRQGDVTLNPYPDFLFDSQENEANYTSIIYTLVGVSCFLLLLMVIMIAYIRKQDTHPIVWKKVFRICHIKGFTKRR